jgi:hypothetical protein
VAEALILVASAGIVLAAWSICALRSTTGGSGAYGGVFAVFVLTAAMFAIWAAMLVVRAWQGKSRGLAAAPISVLASASVLWLALGMASRLRAHASGASSCATTCCGVAPSR